MRKKILLALTLFALLTGVSAQTLQNFEYSPEDDYTVDLTGGESFTQTINFTNEADREVPLVVKVTVSSSNYNMTRSGEEFDLEGSWDPEGFRGASLDFSQTFDKETGDSVYYDTLDGGTEIPSNSDNSVTITFKSSSLIKPDKYGFEVDIRSAPGAAVETGRANVSDNRAEVNVGGSSVSVETSSGVNVTVERYEETALSSPSDRSSFVGGVGVEVRDENNEDAEANGRVTIGYDQQVINRRDLNEDSVNVYFYDDSAGEWTTEGIEIVNRDTADNEVTAEVSHFSTYAAFAEQESTGGSSIPYRPQVLEPENETEIGSVDNESNTTGEETTEDDTDPGNETQPQNETETGTEESEEPSGQAQQSAAPQSPVGQFLESESNIVGGIIVLLAALVALLQYTGRVEIRELHQVLKQKLSRQ